jgi:hypothetical protein
MPVRLQTLFDGFWRRPWLHAWWMVSLVAVPLLAFRHQSELMGCYLPASDRVLQGLPLPGPERWVYPPAFTMPVLPLAMLPVALARVVWALVTVACVMVGVRAIWNAAMEDLAFREAVKRPARFLVFVTGLACTSLGHVIVPLSYQSHDPLVFAMLCVAAVTLARRDLEASRQDRRTGVWLGLAASCKVMPVLFLPALAAARRWRVAIVMGVTGVVVALGFDLASLAWTGKSHFLDWLQLARVGADLGSSGGGMWGDWNPLNQSGTGILHRLTVPTPPTLGLQHECMIVALDPASRRVMLLAWVAGVTGLLALVSWRAWRVRSDAASPPLRALAWVGAVSCGALLVAPQASNYHFAPVGISAAAMLAWMVRGRADAWLVTSLVLMAAIELTPGRDVLGGRWTDIKLAYGSVGICALLACLGGCRVALLAGRPERTRPPA